MGTRRRSKVFIRRPETVLALDALRQERREELVALIQRRWRAFVAIRVQLRQRLEMGALYSEHRKRRRAQSLFRPYEGHYLKGSSLALKDAAKILHHHQDRLSEVLFCDWIQQSVHARLASGSTPPTRAIQAKANEQLVRSRLLIVTRTAAYLIAKASALLPRCHTPRGHCAML